MTSPKDEKTLLAGPAGQQKAKIGSGTRGYSPQVKMNQGSNLLTNPSPMAQKQLGQMSAKNKSSRGTVHLLPGHSNFGAMMTSAGGHTNSRGAMNKSTKVPL